MYAVHIFRSKEVEMGIPDEGELVALREHVAVRHCPHQNLRRDTHLLVHRCYERDLLRGRAKSHFHLTFSISFCRGSALSPPEPAEMSVG